MEPKAKNMKFCYMYRDEGNYKEYGEVIRANPGGLSVEEATARLSGQLIDGEYFYPRAWGVPLLTVEIGVENWYEFVGFEETEEEPTEPRTLEQFLYRLQK